MSDWVRWLVVGIAVVLVLALIGYARGERQRGETVPESYGGAVVVAAARLS